MECSQCGGKAVTTDTRPKGGRALLPAAVLARVDILVYRRKECTVCGDKFTSFELSYDDLMLLHQAGIDTAIKSLQDWEPPT